MLDRLTVSTRPGVVLASLPPRPYADHRQVGGARFCLARFVQQMYHGGGGDARPRKDEVHLGNIGGVKQWQNSTTFATRR